MKARNHTGETHNNWTILTETFKGSLGRCNKVMARCKCGTVREVNVHKIRSGETKSCGCECRKNIIKAATTHGETNTRLFRIWSGMKQRCYMKNFPKFHDYGGRGIKVCVEWIHSYENFRDWSRANGYSDELEIDRTDNNGNYEPDNCRWVDRITNQNNKRNSAYMTVGDETHTVAEWSRLTGINSHALYARIRRGEVGEILLRPIRRNV